MPLNYCSSRDPNLSTSHLFSARIPDTVFAVAALGSHSNLITVGLFHWYIHVLTFGMFRGELAAGPAPRTPPLARLLPGACPRKATAPRVWVPPPAPCSPGFSPAGFPPGVAPDHRAGAGNSQRRWLVSLVGLSQPTGLNRPRGRVGAQGVKCFSTGTHSGWYSVQRRKWDDFHLRH